MRMEFPPFHKPGRPADRSRLEALGMAQAAAVSAETTADAAEPTVSSTDPRSAAQLRRAADRQQDHAANAQERRRIHRHPVSVEATVSFLTRPCNMSGNLENLSRSGARFRASGSLPEGSSHPVELIFTLAGYSFRQTGVVRWNRNGCLGVQFAPMSYLRSRELDEALMLAAIENEPRETESNVSQPEVSNDSHCIVTEEVIEPPTDRTMELAPTRPARERRAHPRLPVALIAAIYLVQCSIRYNGEVENLSLGGCLLRMERRTPLSLFTRVEVSFFHQGMPFRVAGVIQVLHGSERVGIRFLDISPRTGAKLAELMAELEDAQNSEATRGKDNA